MINPVNKPICWFDKKFNSKDSLQMLVVAAVILLVLITKCYMIMVPEAAAKHIHQASQESIRK